MLSDFDIYQALGSDIKIEPSPEAKQVQPASVDLRLGADFKVFPAARVEVVDVRKPMRPGLVRDEIVPDGGSFMLDPLQFALATTVEKISLSESILAWVEGRSSLGRLGLAVHITAGFIDPGFEGQITLELFNHSPNTLALYPGMRICQIAFARLNTPSTRPYQGKYQGQVGTQASKVAEDFK